MSHFLFFFKDILETKMSHFFFKDISETKMSHFYLFLRHFGNKNATVYIIFETTFIRAGLPVCDNAKSVRVKLICCPGATSISQGQSGDPQRPLSVIRLGNTPL